MKALVVLSCHLLLLLLLVLALCACPTFSTVLLNAKTEPEKQMDTLDETEYWEGEDVDEVETSHEGGEVKGVLISAKPRRLRRRYKCSFNFDTWSIECKPRS
ncbi:unnamed protein product [Hydatigera taeniaeformis]|uniref:Uncharacterized protein n=1 Tax=Hydatigena taeniaeformis TaxID=6205 RepID=A0A0R3X779_HYDTA|nr:unnamed protein product [Hydatigera taeniaeformis]